MNSSTMASEACARNSERPRNLTRVAGVQVTQALNGAALKAPEHAGFPLVDSAGEFVAWSACIVAACERMRDVDMRHVTRIERCSDGAVMMFRRAKKKSPGERWDQAVPL